MEKEKMMDDLISRQAAIGAIDDRFMDILSEFPRNVSWEIVKLRTDIYKLPSAQPEIIRCKDCKYAHLTYDGDCKYCDTFTDDDGYRLELYVSGDFYCGNAERRTDG